MLTKFEVPPTRAELMKLYKGTLSFQCAFLNMDLIGIRFLESQEIIVIQYRGAFKCGFIYEGEKFTNAQLLEAYDDAPKIYDDLQEYERKHHEFIELLVVRKHDYVFITEAEVQPKTPIKKL